jgi:hypothetical protein
MRHYSSIMLILGWLTILPVTGQSLQQKNIPEQPAVHVLGKRIAGKLYQPPPSTVKGTPYYNDTWMAGMVIFSYGDTAMINHMNYNACLDELTYLNQSVDSYVIIDHQLVTEFRLIPGSGEPDMKFVCLPLKNVISEKYIQELVEDTISLLVVRKKELTEDPGYPPAIHPDYYKPANHYYFVTRDFSIIKIKPIRRQVYKAFPGYRKSLKRMIRQHHLVLSDENDLIRLVRLINESGITAAPLTGSGQD